MTLGGGRVGGARPGAAVYGRAAGMAAPPDPPDPLDDLPWDPEAPPPSLPPSDPALVVPEVTFELIERDGTHLDWLNHAEQLDWRRPAAGAGSARAVLPRSLAVVTECVPPRIMRVWYRGVAIHDALIAPINDATYQPGEEGDQTRTANATGSIGILGEGLVDPWKVTNRPTADSMRFDFSHPDFQMPADWVAATELAAQGDVTEHWTGLPARWPAGPTPEWIASSTDTTNDADPGVFYGRRKYTTGSQTYAAIWTADNFVTLYIDGVAQGEVKDYHGFQRVDVRMTAGEHTFATLWGNYPQVETNPTGFLFALCPIDDAGRLGAPILISDASWRILARPAYTPGWKLGRIVNYCLDRLEGRGGPQILRGFTDDLDTAGEDWPTLPGFTIANNASLEDLVARLEEVWVDARMRVGSLTLDLWNNDTRGVDRTEQLGSNHDGVTHPCVASLDHQTDPPYATRILAHYADAYVERRVTVPGFYVERPLEIPNALTRGEAIETIDRLLTLHGRPRTKYTATLVPRLDAQRPHIGFQEADTVPLKDPDGNWAQVRVQSIQGTYRPQGRRLTLTIEAGDTIIDDEDAIQAWLQQRAAGAFGGRARQSTSTQAEPARQLVAAVRGSLVFHRPAIVTEIESDPKRPGEASRIVEFPVTLGTSQITDIDVDLLIDGVTAATTTVPTGDKWATTRLNIPLTQGEGDITVSCPDTGFSIVAEVITE